jgi:hypothetical protein
LDGSLAGASMGGGYRKFADFDNDGNNDMFIPELINASGDGAIYILLNSTLQGYSGTGNTVDLSSSATYNYIYTGPGGANNFSFNFTLGDLNGDGRLDLVIPGTSADYNSRNNSGSLWLIYNFPHTVSANSFGTTSSQNPTVSGSVSVSSNSTTSLSGVQLQYDSNSASGTWINCSLQGSSYICQGSPNLPNGAHTAYIRAYDSLTTYTKNSSYGSFTFTIGPDAPSSSSNPNQLPNWSKPITSGPHFQGTNQFLTSQGVDSSCANVFVPNNASPNDLNTSITKVSSGYPFPWSQGLNLASDVWNISIVSAFNGYPVTLSNPMIVELCFNPNLTNSQNLKIAYLNPVNTWVVLPQKPVINQNRLAVTSLNPGLYAVEASPVLTGAARVVSTGASSKT